MSSIVAKAFDATQKIMRSIFRGTPNLFTTSDLNRQIEAFDYRLKQLEWFRGVETDMQFSVSKSESRVLTISYSYIRIYGCTLYSGATVTRTFERPEVYSRCIYLYLIPTVIDYSADSTHLISGAKFADGSSQPAADNIVVSSWGFGVLDVDDEVPFFKWGADVLQQTSSTAYVDENSNALPEGSFIFPIWLEEGSDSRRILFTGPNIGQLFSPDVWVPDISRGIIDVIHGAMGRFTQVIVDASFELDGSQSTTIARSIGTRYLYVPENSGSWMDDHYSPTSFTFPVAVWLHNTANPTAPYSSSDEHGLITASHIGSGEWSIYLHARISYSQISADNMPLFRVRVAGSHTVYHASRDACQY